MLERTPDNILRDSNLFFSKNFIFDKQIKIKYYFIYVTINIKETNLKSWLSLRSTNNILNITCTETLHKLCIQPEFKYFLYISFPKLIWLYI